MHKTLKEQTALQHTNMSPRSKNTSQNFTRHIKNGNTAEGSCVELDSDRVDPAPP